MEFKVGRADWSEEFPPLVCTLLLLASLGYFSFLNVCSYAIIQFN